MKYETTNTIFSATGNTPVTNRIGSYCDVLAKVTMLCETPEQAKAKTLELKKQTEHAYSCHFSMPDYPNQNTRSQFCHYGF